MSRIEAHSPAAYSQIQIGDRLRMVSSAFDGGRPALASHPLQAASQQQDRVRSPLHSLQEKTGLLAVLLHVL